MDYSEVKRIANTVLVDKWDHAFLVYSEDVKLLQFLQSLEDHKTVVLDTPPTAENLVLTAFGILDAAYQDTYGNHLRLEQVRLFETPNCWADATRAQVLKKR
jgi:6-pyruvoyltetrahydropterin/6-carboxytetrahydropterin synthase